MPALAYWTTAALLALSALALLAWSLFADRARGRARCPRCWYELAGLAPGAAADTPPRCPECGHEPRHHRRLYRTRRRWRWAALAILLFIGAAALAMYPHARAAGWKQLLPHTAIIAATHFTDEEWPYRELARRTPRRRQRTLGRNRATFRLAVAMDD